MTNALPDDPTAQAIAKKRRELLTLRAGLESQIKAIDASIAVLGKAIAVFDPSTKVHLDAHGLKAKRFPHTKRFVLSILRDASKPLTPTEIAQAWMGSHRIDDTKTNRKIILGRVASCLQACRLKGLVERDPDGGWRLASAA